MEVSRSRLKWLSCSRVPRHPARLPRRRRDHDVFYPPGPAATAPRPDSRSEITQKPGILDRVPEVLVRARGLTKRFGSFTAVDGIDFDLFQGCLLYTSDAADDLLC